MRGPSFILRVAAVGVGPVAHDPARAGALVRLDAGAVNWLAELLK